MALFDAYVMVDWSAAARPCQGPDSIWISLSERGTDGFAQQAPVNPPTRAAAIAWLADRLSDLAARGRTSLLGFDFNFGFPGGFAAQLTEGRADWRTLWRHLAGLVTDHDDNGNDRFALAGRLNARLSGGAFPFWGCPATAAGPTLNPKKPAGFADGSLPEFRLTERRVPGVQSVWKLYTSGAVGSQTLLGIPRLLALREHPWLKDHLRIWPFETGLARLERPAPGGIVMAEVYPSLIDADPAPVKDAGQVSALVRHFARLDETDRLAELFAGDPGLSKAERTIVETEEGWILGVGNSLKAHRAPRPLAGEGGARVSGRVREPRRPPIPHPPTADAVGPSLSRFRAGEGQSHSTENEIIQDPAEIYRRSFAIIRREADLSRFSGPMEELAVRVVHACGMPDVAALLAFRAGAAEAGCRALAAGRPILVDAQMVAHGIIRRRLPAGNPVICRLDDARLPGLAETGATTRSAAAVRLWEDRLEDAVVAIGNAPTALFELLAMLAGGAPRPALILGFPVGFVGAVESKEALIATELPYIALPGRRGGSAMAAAAVNALAGAGR